jgi:glycosyltransferase involved in cell wall biosynthesis
MIVDEHNVEYKRFEEIGKGNRPALKLMKIIERFFCRRSEFVFSVSENDRHDLARLFDLDEDRLLLVPNGVNTGRFQPDPHARAATRDSLGIGPDTRLVLFVGNMVYAPNREAVGRIRDEIAPRILEEGHDAAFVVVGEKAPDFDSGDNIVFTGLVESVAEYFNACDISIAPLLAGGGTRLKILESLACGRRIISTGKGAEGIEECEPVVISDNWEDFSSKVVENWDAGYDEGAVEFARRHSWNSIASSVYDVLSGKS